MEKFNATVKNWLSIIDDNAYVSAALSIFLILYAGLAAPKLSPGIAALFENPIIQLFVFFLIAYMANKNPTVSIIAAIAVFISLQTLSRYKVDLKLRNLAYRTDMAIQRQADMQRQYNDRGVSVSPEDLNELQNGKMDPGCTKVGKYRNNFYPQYVNMKPYAYMARSQENAVSGYDSSAAYATL